MDRYNYNKSRNGDENGSKKFIPNFWPQSKSFPLIDTSIITESDLDNDTFNQSDAKKSVKSTSKPKSSGRRFISKSANKSNKSGTALINSPKTAKPKMGHFKSVIVDPYPQHNNETNLDLQGIQELDGNWMKVLQKRSQGDQDLEKSPNPTRNGVRQNSQNQVVKDDDSFSVMSEFPRSLFTAGSSDGISIGWADDAVESESTETLARHWVQIEQVFYGETSDTKPPEMSESVYEEILLWRRAFNHQSKSGSSKKPKCFSVPAKLPIPIYRDPCPNVEDLDITSLMSLLTEFGNLSPTSPRSLTPTQTPSRSERRHPAENVLGSGSAFSESGPSFVQSWLEKLTTNFNFNDSDHYEFTPLPPVTHEQDETEDSEYESLPYESLNQYPNPIDSRYGTSGTRNVKVQRPISSQYLNRSFGDNRNTNNRLGSAVDFDLNMKFKPKLEASGAGDNSGHKSTIFQPFDSDNEPNLQNSHTSSASNRCLSGRSKSRSMTFCSSENNRTSNGDGGGQSGLNRCGSGINTTWSRHSSTTIEASNEEEVVFGNGKQGQKILSGSRNPINRREPRKNFISWLLFDENDENVLQDS